MALTKSSVSIGIIVNLKLEENRNNSIFLQIKQALGQCLHAGCRAITILRGCSGVTWEISSQLSKRNQLDGWVGLQAQESWRIRGGKGERGVGKACGKSRHCHIKYNWYVDFCWIQSIFVVLILQILLEINYILNGWEFPLSRNIIQNANFCHIFLEFMRLER